MRHISIDSRTIQPGDYFVPIKGPSFDGHDFIGDAVQKGGILLDVELTPYAKKYRKKLTSAVIAVTGSAGKTTVKELLSSLLSQRFDVVKTHHNENNEIQDDNRIIPGHVQIEVYKRDKGQCVKCGSKDHLHLDHIYPFAKGGTSKDSKNIQLLCRRHNLKKSDKVGG